RRLNRKKPETLAPTKEEVEAFERLWAFRAKFTKRPGDPKKPALLKFCQQMRKKPVPVEEIEYGIRCEYGPQRDNPSLYAPMETFMHQRRWENYDFASYQRMRAQRAAISAAPNVTPLRRPQQAIDSEARRRHFESLRAQNPLLAGGDW